MGLKCFFNHQFGLPRLDARGVAWRQCILCGKVDRIEANLAPSVEQAEALAARRAQAIALLGERWVGRPSPDSDREPNRPALKAVEPVTVPAPDSEDANRAA